MSIVLKTLNTLEPRELFMMDNHFGIYLGQHDIQGHMHVNLSSLQFVFTQRFDLPEAVSYGKKWFLEVDNIAFTDEKHAGVYIGEKGPLIRVQDGQELYCFDIATAQRVSTPHKLARAGNWRIWASKEDWASPNGSPVLIGEGADK